MTDALTVFVTGELGDARLAALRAAAPGAELRHFATAADMAPAIAQADAVAGDLPADMLAQATRVRWVHSWAAGPDKQLYPAFIASPVLLTCCKGNGAIPLAEHAILQMLMLNRNALRWHAAQQQRRWDHFVHGELNGLTCGIIGTGYSGIDLALKAKAFHMRTIGIRRHPQPTPHFDHIHPRAELHAFLAESDFVVVTAPRTPETEGMLGEAEFRAMKPTAHYICFSRGGIADDAALLRALTEGWIAGAGLDAHDVEPLPPESPFWTAPNTIVTPHNGASTRATRDRGFAIFVENLRRHVAGEPLVNIVDKTLGY
jgi:phosphoglycerate dehydrogenase-like enzyme